MTRTLLLSLLAGLLALGLAACETDDEPEETAAAGEQELDEPDEADDGGDEAEADADGAVVEIELELGDMFFEPSEIVVPAGATVEFTLANEGGAEHDLVFDGEGESDMVNPGEAGTFQAGPFEEDTTGWCDVPGHREAGMELDVVVTD
ncbi:hypothetical protein ER308_09860 [Egibacter rhizosphaerae]|uniref:EfeO-type cupredoxin-like domain-containing protein n=1 Tax=Egibacter rhizosphaerae TaxID=1670831 RepID=A0A411YF75_9ACTN|nr:cupredoxin domain-containing protein [Egibacter rhizosphaerae]QBI19831.1 hypothetical protein ER308_09860 [Egibacter rhizosphaerae]